MKDVFSFSDVHKWEEELLTSESIDNLLLSMISCLMCLHFPPRANNIYVVLVRRLNHEIVSSERIGNWLNDLCSK